MASPKPQRFWSSLLRRNPPSDGSATPDSGSGNDGQKRHKWSLGILEDPETIEVPGSVLLLAADRNEPLGLNNAPARTSRSSIATGVLTPRHEPPPEPPKKRTADGKIILDPQPEDSANDPLNWPSWRRDLALLSLGLYCMVGGGTTPILAAGFTDVALEYGVDVHDVSLTTGLYMMGMGLGSVVFSPTAILWGKRPVYLFGAVLFIATSIWCAASPSFGSLVAARILQGFAVSPVECLPSATIAEIFFLHERAFRIGIYTLLLLGGKNLVPLVSAVVIQNMGWRWVFWILAFVVAFCGVLLFLFVPETFWDRAPVPRAAKKSRPSILRRLSSGKIPVLSALSHHHHQPQQQQQQQQQPEGVFTDAPTTAAPTVTAPAITEATPKTSRVGFVEIIDDKEKDLSTSSGSSASVSAQGEGETAPEAPSAPAETAHAQASHPAKHPASHGRHRDNADAEAQSIRSHASSHIPMTYTHALRTGPPRSFAQSLRPYNGRLNKDKWHKVLVRPLILLSYPAVLWSSVVYSCSVGWLIVISESMAVIYREGAYNFNALQTGLVYISPFVGGILGSAVAGRVSDVIVQAMARRNGGLYEPEYRLVMAAPIALTTVLGLMGFGWSAEVGNHWMVPTAFFGIISFGCTMGSTTSITFCVDSYRQYAGEALVTLNFSKNILHGLVFSLFVTGWLSDDGPKMVYIWIGIIQLILLLFTIPMYIFGKRLRMWTVRKNFMERF
ncbi:hypothetical protein VTJ83DRAFT_1608 [Remersonia thermophila]|uniref:Major facilitator superfamily (MFS) profile domain-containing protein n=1 Tax=Remersonia thermophila TaxID=72144 RepID=A0ABR4DGK6_9PEZI